MRETIDSLGFDPISKLNKDLKEASQSLQPEEVRYLVDLYYILQDGRIRADGQIRSMGRDNKEPHATISWLSGNFGTLENNIKRSLGVYAENQTAGDWALRQHGIGPVIASGFCAHIDITKTPTVSALWSFAGLNPKAVWKKGEKRPWNARLKVLCWKAGESFKKFSNSPKCFYGKFYRQRKQLEEERNEAGMFKDLAKEKLENFKMRKDTDTYTAYKVGKLPPGRLDLRATRYATKIFLSHFWEKLYESHYGKPAEDPWIIEHGGHTHKIQRPE